ncbi:MAG TPA: hypothetical protein DEH22_03865 [Chloroflexi bacterium]|nr:hypothetical protein [Chloroflexota bacterium]
MSAVGIPSSPGRDRSQPGLAKMIDQPEARMTELNLTQAVEKFALVTCHLSDDDLEREWTWRAYSEGVRFALLRTYEELRTLAAVMIAERAVKGAPITTTHHALAQYHAAYRDLQVLLVGLDDALLNQPPARDQWPLRVILGHIMAAEREFFARIWYAVQQVRRPVAEDEIAPKAVEMSAAEVAEFVGSFEDFERTMNRLRLTGIMAYFDTLHKRVLRELTDIKGFELDAESLWWEETPFTVEFRLHRLDSHLRQHTVQIEKTLEALVGPPSEARRLLRLIYAALADVDSIIVGDWGFGKEQRRELAGKISLRADEIAAIFER